PHTPPGLLSGSLSSLNNQGIGVYSSGSENIWRNNCRLSLYDLVENPPWDFAYPAINNHGLIAISVIRNESDPPAVSLLIPMELTARDADTGEIRPVLASEYGNTPIPDVTLHIESAVIREDGALEVSLSGSVRDKFSEVLDDRSKWVQSL